MPESIPKAPSPVAILQRLTLEIKQLDMQAREDTKDAIRYRTEIGRRLLAGRTLIRKEPGWRGRNEWEDWGNREFGYKKQALKDHLFLYRNGQISVHFDENTTFYGALSLIRKALKAQKLQTVSVKMPVWIITGRVPRQGGKDEEQPALEALLAAVTDWKVRRG